MRRAIADQEARAITRCAVADPPRPLVKGERIEVRGFTKCATPVSQPSLYSRPYEGRGEANCTEMAV